jgi:hypothetical protein
LPAEERSHNMNLKEDNVKVPEYKPTDVNLLTTYTRIIPLTSTTAVMDPRTPPEESYYSTYRNKLSTNEFTKGSFTSYTNTKEDVAELREQPVEIPLETNDKIWDPTTTTNSHRLFNIDYLIIFLSILFNFLKSCTFKCQNFTQPPNSKIFRHNLQI